VYRHHRHLLQLALLLVIASVFISQNDALMVQLPGVVFWKLMQLSSILMNLVTIRKRFVLLTGVMLWRPSFLLFKLMTLGVWYLLFLGLISLTLVGYSR
jgi:hypothetical protein